MRSPLFLLLGVLFCCGCANNGTEPNGKLRVVATTSMLAEMVRDIGGDQVSVDGLMGPGVDPHLYKASEGDVMRMAGADVVIYNGLHLEGKMVDLFEEMDGRGVTVLAAAEQIPDSLYLESEYFTGNYDPHIWFDASIWSLAAHAVGRVLAEVDTAHAAAYENRADAYIAMLDSTHAYVKERTRELPVERRVLVTSHDAFGYFGRAYGFHVRGLQGISTASEAGTADVQELADYVAAERVPAMFIESSVSPRGIEAVRAAVRSRGYEVEIGGTLYGDALGPVGTGADTYRGMVRSNIDVIVAGMSADS